MALLFAPVMPDSSAEVWRRLGLGDVFAAGNESAGQDANLAAGVSPLAAGLVWGGLPAGNMVQIGEPLFPRLDLSKLEY
jgi:methionyl-tRNA synthetase